MGHSGQRCYRCSGSNSLGSTQRVPESAGVSSVRMTRAAYNRVTGQSLAETPVERMPHLPDCLLVRLGLLCPAEPCSHGRMIVGNGVESTSGWRFKMQSMLMEETGSAPLRSGGREETQRT